MQSPRPTHLLVHAPPVDEGGGGDGQDALPVPGSETFFILGEGLLGVTAGGRRAAAADERAGATCTPSETSDDSIRRTETTL